MRLIDADELVKSVYDKAACYTDRDGYVMVRRGEIAIMIDDAPTIDAVPVVRCKDCKYSNTDHAISTKRTWCDYWAIDPDFNDYCSHGKRKDGGE